jgi:hypothetical protein
MKTKLASLQTIAFALPLALWIPLSAQTQGTGELKPASQTNDSEQVFNFPGGTPRDFMQAVEKHFKVDWLSIASIPDFVQQPQVPKLRYTAGPTTAISAHQLADLYNRVSERSPELGTLVVEGDYSKPSVVMLVPNRSREREQPRIKVKAFPIWGLSDSVRDKLRADIEQARVEAIDYAVQRGGDSLAIRSLEGTVAIHSDTKLLVAIGPESYVEMVASIVAAYGDRAAANDGPTRGAPTPGK